MSEWATFHSYASSYYRGIVAEYDKEATAGTFRTAKDCSNAKIAAALHDLVAAVIESKFSSCPAREKHPALHDVWQDALRLLLPHR